MSSHQKRQKSGPKLLKKLSNRFKKRKDTPLKPIPSNCAVLDTPNSQPRVKGSVRRNDSHDEKLLSEMKAEFKDVTFNSVAYVMSSLPSSLSMDYLVEQSQYYKEYCDAVERTFKKRLMDNSHSFIVGMQQIQDVKLDLHLTAVLCRNARRTLKESDMCLVHKCFNVISTYQRRKRLVDTVKTLYSIQKLKDIEEELHKYLDENSFILAISHHTFITSLIFGSLKNVLSLELMRKRFRDGNGMITNKLSLFLLELIYDAPLINVDRLLIVFQSYYKLESFHLMNGLLLKSFCAIIQIKCRRQICVHLGYNEHYINRNYGLNYKNIDYVDYKNLCRKLKPVSFMRCFMDVCGRIFDILYLYYKTENILMSFRDENDILSESMRLVRKELWIETQTCLGILLESSEFSLKTTIKMEDLLLSLHGARVFKIIGAAFSGSDCIQLQTSIRTKCVSYLDHFRKTFFESIKTNFDNEMWVVLPIPSNFGIHSIKELQRINESRDNDDSSFYQSFLNGDNIFDLLLLDKEKSDKVHKHKHNNIFECDNNVINIHIINEPCITSTSLNLAKFIGRCLQIMESLDPVAYDTFCALKNSFHFYLYHVFIWFGVNVHNFFFNKMELAIDEESHINQSVAQKKYPILSAVINEVNESLQNRKLAPDLEDLIIQKLKKTRRPRRLPHYAKCYMESSQSLELYSHQTMQGVAPRFVATETLTFLVNVIKSQHGRLINILHVKHRKEVSNFIIQIENVVIEFKKYMYRNVPTLLIHLGSVDNKESIINHINNTNWNMKEIAMEPNGYVKELADIFTKIENVLSSFPTLPKFIHNRLNVEAMLYVEEQLVDAYSNCKKCTTEGRALMSLDQSVLKKSYPICKYKHEWQYTTNFIQAYYLPQKDLLKWIQKHPQYPLKAHKSFIKIGRASENLKRKEKQILEKEIERIYAESKQKQEEERKELVKEQQNKPNLDEIKKTINGTTTNNNNNNNNTTNNDDNQ